MENEPARKAILIPPSFFRPLEPRPASAPPIANRLAAACSPPKGTLRAMAPQPTPILALPPPVAGLIPTRDKVRFRFRKDGALRLLSHHDLMRCFERMLRRAALPVRQSQGFHPKPRLIFALSLPLGVIGCEEVAELELDEILPPEEVRERLVRQAPAGMEILDLRRIDFKAGAQIRSLTYRMALPAERSGGRGRAARG